MSTGTTASTGINVELALAVLAAQTYLPSGFTAGYTELANYSNTSVLAKVTTSTGTQACSATNGVSTNWAGAIATFSQ